MTFFLLKNNHCDLDLGPRTLKLEIIQDLFIVHVCKNKNRSTNEGARALTMFF